MNTVFYQSIRNEIKFSFAAQPENKKNCVPDNVQLSGAPNPRALHAVNTRAKGSSTCPLHDDAFAHAKVVRSVNALPDHQNALMIFCYTNRGQDWQCITTVAEFLWAKFEVFLENWQLMTGKKIKPEKVKKLQSLAFNAMLHFKEGASARKKLYTADMLANLMLISGSNWRRDWAPFWNQLLIILTELDEQALISVAQQSKPAVAA
jgi:hypothetical protein